MLTTSCSTKQVDSAFDASGSLILIVGMGRSGTTWLAKLFDSHPRTLLRMEPEAAIPFDGVPSVVLPHEVVEFAELIRSYVASLSSNRLSSIAGGVPVFRKERESMLAFRLRQMLVPIGIFAEKLHANPRLPLPTKRVRDGTDQLVWKSVQSLGRVGAIMSAIASVRVILIIRHPCGVIASRARGEARGDFKPVSSGSGKYHEVERLLETRYSDGLGISSNELASLDPMERQAIRWAILNQKVMADIEGREGCAVVRYEDLCTDPRDVCARLFETVGLSWHSQTERFIAESTSSHSSRYYSVFKRPEVVANAWKGELSASDQDRVQCLVAKSRPGQLFMK